MGEKIEGYVCTNFFYHGSAASFHSPLAKVKSNGLWAEVCIASTSIYNPFFAESREATVHPIRRRRERGGARQKISRFSSREHVLVELKLVCKLVYPLRGVEKADDKTQTGVRLIFSNNGNYARARARVVSIPYPSATDERCLVSLDRRVIRIAITFSASGIGKMGGSVAVGAQVCRITR